MFEEPSSVDPITVGAGFIKLKVDHLTYTKRVGTAGGITQLSSRVSSSAAWSPPPPSFVKVNVDAHIRHDGGVQFGMVARDEWGTIVAAGVRRMAVNWDPSLAEARVHSFWGWR